MCGIGGKFYFDSTRRVQPRLLERMNAVLAHRGPDDAGIYQEGRLGLTHRRLSIIDLSPAGHQPMTNAARTLWITYNGEIYNFLELRAELEREGVRFRSRTDTEVILALYAKYGTDCLARLRGMFAFAIWDAPRERLFLARDRLGKKPLVYFHDHRMLLFASEPKAILADPEVPVAPDLRAIHDYLTYGYVPGPGSAFRGFHKLPPGHFLLARAGGVHVERYWRLRYGPKLRLSEADAGEAVLAHLRDAVRLRMISDVPLGAFLSGGLDSSAVVACMSEVSSRPVKTFSIGFEDQSYNELGFARLVAERFGTDHHEFIVKPDAVAILPDLVWHYNEPYADSSAIPSYYLAKMTREHVTVALNGDAGDENFAGYDRYVANVFARRYQRLPRFLRAPLEGAVRALPEFGGPRGAVRRAQRFFAAAGDDPWRRYARWVGVFDDASKAELYGPALREAAVGCDSIDFLRRAYEAVDADLVDATLGVDVGTYLPDDLLVKVDIASMAHSLEARSPMVDHVFMEFAATLPSSLKLRGRTGKYIFRKALRGRLPDAIIDRPKMGFGVPIERWFREELRELAYDTLLGRQATQRGLFRPERVRRLLDEHVGGRRARHGGLWALLVLELWFQRFIDGHRP